MDPLQSSCRRGYFLARLTVEQKQVACGSCMTRVERHDGRGYTERSWLIEDGVHGA